MHTAYIHTRAPILAIEVLECHVINFTSVFLQYHWIAHMLEQNKRERGLIRMTYNQVVLKRSVVSGLEKRNHAEHEIAVTKNDRQ